jgi:regulator of sigma E protease
MGHTIISFIIVIGILVFIHELGHFLAARAFGVGVKVFSLGFGPKIFKKTVGMTEYCISAIPLGGYVKMIGEEPGTALYPKDIPLSFSHKPLIQKSIIVAAGPLSNFFLAIFIFYILFQFSGLYLNSPKVGKVLDGTPAAMAGIQPDDLIRTVNGIRIESFDELPVLVNENKDAMLNIIIEREGENISISLKPVLSPSKNIFGENIGKYVIGIVASKETYHVPLNPVQALAHSLKSTWELIELTVLSVVKMINGSISAKNIGGPIMIAQMAGEQAKAGFVNLAWFIALLSVNLGIINLLPIPVLDGGHLLFFAVEGILQKPLNEKLREKLLQFGIALMLLLMVFVFYNDIARIFVG